MELSDIDISQISVPEGIRLERISFHQVENKNKKNKKEKKKKAPKTYRSFLRDFFRFSSEGKLLYKANDFSGEAEDINPTAQSIVDSIKISNIVITNTTDATIP